MNSTRPTNKQNANPIAMPMPTAAPVLICGACLALLEFWLDEVDVGEDIEDGAAVVVGIDVDDALLVAIRMDDGLDASVVVEGEADDDAAA
jgi:hypothetical protein